MHSQIPRINDTNYERTVAEVLAFEDRTETLKAIRDVITMMPHKSTLVSRLMGDLARSRLDLKDEMVRMVNSVASSSNIDHLLSAAFTIKRLGLRGSDVFSWVKDVPSIGNPVFGQDTFAQPSPDILEKCGEEVERIEKMAGMGGIEEMVCTMQVIKNFEFSVRECLFQLSFVSDPVRLIDAARAVVSRERMVYLSVILIEYARRQDFLKMVLERLPGFDTEFRDTFLPLLFESFYSPGRENSVFVSSSYSPLGNDEEMELFRSLVTEDTIKVMRRISGPDKTQRFLSNGAEVRMDRTEIAAMSREEFEQTEFVDREAFFEGLCRLGSPSVSHFLAYLEMYKDDFVLSDEEQRMFLSVFSRMFGDSESFRHIVLGKMSLFKMLDQKLIDEFER